MLKASLCCAVVAGQKNIDHYTLRQRTAPSSLVDVL